MCYDSKIRKFMDLILSGASCFELAQKTSQACQIPMASYQTRQFADQEIFVEIQDSLKGKHIYLFQSTSPPVNQNVVELLLLLDTLKREKVSGITLVMPYYGYSRQDRQTQIGQPVSAQCLAELYQSFQLDQCFFLEIHSPQILNFFKIPVQNLSSQKLMTEMWKKTFPSKKDVICVSPDKGGKIRCQTWAQEIGADSAWIQKLRNRPNEAQAMDLYGNVENKTALILDDMIDTAGTLCTAVDKLIENKAKEVFVIATHGLFSGKALSRIEKSPIQQVWVTDSVKSASLQQCKKIKTISSADIFVTALKEDLKKRGIKKKEN